MPFRDDRDALVERVSALERDLAVARREAAANDPRELPSKLAASIRRVAELEASASRLMVAVGIVAIASLVVSGYVAIDRVGDATRTTREPESASPLGDAARLEACETEVEWLRHGFSEARTALEQRPIPTSQASRPPPGIVGRLAPVIDRGALDGRATTYAGHVTIVMFGASWSEPSRDEAVVLERLLAARSDDGLAVVAISEDASAERAGQIGASTHVTFPVVHDVGHALIVRFGAMSMPATYVVDQSGVVRYALQGYRSPDQWQLASWAGHLLGADPLARGE